MTEDRRRITIAILALGGQGGGVLADWIIAVGEANGYVAQGTSVAGVAQRTGSTVYYIEMIPPDDRGTTPVLALNPVPGDVDVVIASELMETGRAILRGFVTADRTTLIGSTHRIYAVSEKAAMGNGLGNGDKIIAAAERRSKRFVGFDMDAAAAQAKTVISSIMLGALAGSDALPFTEESYRDAIRAGGKAIPTNLAGFDLGMASARSGVRATAEQREVATGPAPIPSTAAGRALAQRIEALPAGAQRFALEAAKRLMDYQDAGYVTLYLDRLETVAALDRGDGDHRLTAETARYLALWMSYEDTIRVADLKVRATRLARVRGEVLAKPEELLHVTEYMHPRFQEICETLPMWIGKPLLGSAAARRWLGPLFAKGRHVETTSLRWFAMLYLVAGMRRIRRSTLRFHEEQARIEAWLRAVRATTRRDHALAIELVECQRLVKGYGDTFERGLANFETIMHAAATIEGDPGAAETVARLRAAALADEKGAALGALVAGLALAA
jgi:indolepyruvate ferredoxin oxidoreductase beta subunit